MNTRELQKSMERRRHKSKALIQHPGLMTDDDSTLPPLKRDHSPRLHPLLKDSIDVDDQDDIPDQAYKQV